MHYLPPPRQPQEGVPGGGAVGALHRELPRPEAGGGAAEVDGALGGAEAPRVKQGRLSQKKGLLC